jgi:hypothetical protein
VTGACLQRCCWVCARLAALQLLVMLPGVPPLASLRLLAALEGRAAAKRIEIVLFKVCAPVGWAAVDWAASPEAEMVPATTKK